MGGEAEVQMMGRHGTDKEVETEHWPSKQSVEHWPFLSPQLHDGEGEIDPHATDKAVLHMQVRVVDAN
jgi:hypothetical protein